jgi:hypothetical protein
LSVVGYLAFLATVRSLPLGPVVALRETSVIFGSLIGIFVLKHSASGASRPRHSFWRASLFWP